MNVNSTQQWAETFQNTTKTTKNVLDGITNDRNEFFEITTYIVIEPELIP